LLDLRDKPELLGDIEEFKRQLKMSFINEKSLMLEVVKWLNYITNLLV